MKRMLLSSSVLLAAMMSLPAALAQQSTEARSWIDVVPFRDIGPSNMSGRIIAITVNHAKPTHYVLATASGGLLKTVNNGTTFEHIFDDQEVVSIGDVCMSQSNPDIIWVGTGENNPRNSVSYGNGVYRSLDGGKTWEHMGLKGTFQIGAIEVHPENPDIVYVGALGRLYGPNDERGLYKTEDGGKTWEKIHYIDERTGVIAIEMHPTDPDTFLFATYDRERDGFDTNDPSRRFGPGAGLYRTTDGGQTVERVVEGLPTCNLGRIGLDYCQSNPDILYATVESELIGKLSDKVGFLGTEGEDAETGARITGIKKGSPAEAAGLKEGDIVLEFGGENVLSYTQLIERERSTSPGDAISIKYVRNKELKRADITIAEVPKPEEDQEDPPQGRRRRQSGDPYGTYLGGQVANIQDQQGAEGNNYGGVYRSDDGGITWKRVNSLNPRPMYFSHIAVDPNNDQNVYVSGVSFHRSVDGGKTFTDDAGRGVHADIQALWVDPNDSDHLLLCCDGGLYATHDRCENWDHLNHMAIGQFYHVGVSPDVNYRVYGGLQDNGSWGGPSRGTDGSGPINQDWTRIGGGDGFICLVDPNDADQIYYESQNGSMGRVNLRTGERGSIRPPRDREAGATRFNWKTPFILSSHNSRIFYCAGNTVFRSLDRGNDLRAISDNITLGDKGSATALAESYFNPDVLYVGSDDGALWMTKDGGREWLNLAEFEESTEEIATEPEPESESASTNSGPNASHQDETKEVTGEVTEASAIDGKWKGSLKSDDGPPGSRGFTIEITFKDSQVSGVVTSEMGDSEIVEGKFDPETKKLNFTTESDFGEATWEASLKEEKLIGSFSAMDGQFTMEFEATRESGTDDSKIQDTQDEKGAETATITGKALAELIPGPRWVASLETSRHKEGRVYVALDAHRSDDDNPYVFVSEDFGKTWTSIAMGLPWGSTRVLREDLKNQDILYCGTEFGLWVSLDRGNEWTKFKGDFPTVSVHEIAQPSKIDEIAIATHGRSLWIADVSILRQMTKKSFEDEVVLYQPNDVIQWRRTPGRGSEGTRVYSGTNAPSVAHVAYRLAENSRDVSLTIKDLSGKLLTEIEASGEKGLHYVAWDLRARGRANNDGEGGGGRRRRTPSVSAGTYVASLEVNGRTYEQRFEVKPDPDSTTYGAAFEEGYEEEGYEDDE